MKNIILIRHGQSLGQTSRENGINRQKDPSLIDCFLSRKGVQEAIQLRSNEVLSRYKFDLICTSPLSRAISTCLLALGGIMEEELETNETPQTPFIARADICEVGGKIPENQGRPLRPLLKDLEQKLSMAYYPAVTCLNHIDFSMLPDTWPARDEGSSKADRGLGIANFMEWLRERPEENIAVVCHYNVIRWMLRNEIRHVPNCMPIECVLGDDGVLVLKSGGSSSLETGSAGLRHCKDGKKNNKGKSSKPRK